MKIEILCTGDEILTGKTVNTNYSHIARRLQESGFTVHHGTVVGDDRADLKSAFIQASHRSDVVIVNGGLGPTSDDLSQEVAAEAMGVELEMRQSWLDRIDAWYASRGRKMPSSNNKQAMLPIGAELVDNPVGTACGFIVTINQARFFFTPGVPMEMKRMLEEQVLGWLGQLRGIEMVSRVKRFHTFGLGESRAAMMLQGVEEMGDKTGVKLGFQSHFPQLEVKLAAQSINHSVLNSTMAPVEQALRHQLGHFTVAEDDQTIEGRILSMLDQNESSVAILEMLTAGAVTGRLAGSRREQSRVSQSMVTGDIRDLVRFYDGVPIDDIMSQDLAMDLAQIVQQQGGAEYGLVVLSSWVSLEERSLEGMDIFIGIADSDRVQGRTSRLPGNTRWARLGATEMALDCFRRYLAGLPVYERIDFEQH